MSTTEELEQIEEELEGLLRELIEVQGKLLSLEQEALLKIQDIEDVFRIEWENLGHEKKIRVIEESLLVEEKHFLEIKRRKGT